MSSIMSELKDILVNKNYSFTTMTRGCLGIPEFNFIDNNGKIIKHCQSNYYKKVRSNILNDGSNNIIIFGGRLPLYLSGEYFDNKEGGIEHGKWYLKLDLIH